MSYPGHRQTKVRLLGIIGTLLMVVPLTVRALEVEGVQPYALDQPRVPALLRPAGGGDPLTTRSELTGQNIFAFECFLDTGATRITMSRTDRDALGVKSTGKTVEDWGIGGTQEFELSEPYRLCVGDTSSSMFNPAGFQNCMTTTMQLSRSDKDLLEAMPKGLSEQLTGGSLGLGKGSMEGMFTVAMNIIGTPFLENHVAVLDLRPVQATFRLLSGLSGAASGGTNKPTDLLGGLLQSMASGGATSGRIAVQIKDVDEDYAQCQLNVPLNMRDVEEKPVPVASAPAPFIDDVQLENGEKSVEASLLLDTGGGVTIISPDLARKLGLDLGEPALTAPVMGVGKGTQELKGYWVDRMELPTAEEERLVFRNVPLFVADLRHLDGTLGVNMLVPSLYIDMDMQAIGRNPLAILGSMKGGMMPFRRIVLDLPGEKLGLDPVVQARGVSQPAPKEQ